jgi:hypothetical protein
MYYASKPTIGEEEQVFVKLNTKIELHLSKNHPWMFFFKNICKSTWVGFKENIYVSLKLKNFHTRELYEHTETKFVFLTPCLFNTVLLPHLWRALSFWHAWNKKWYWIGIVSWACIDSWIAKEYIVMHRCTGGLLHPYSYVKST